MEINADTPVEELVRTINVLKTGNADLSTKVDSLTETLHDISEKQAQRAIRNAAPTGNVELTRFQGREADVQAFGSRYLVNDGGAVRMRSHTSDGVKRPGLLDGPAESEFQAEFQRAVQRRNIARIALRAGNGPTGDHRTPELDNEIAMLMRSAPRELGALRDVGERIWSGSAGIGIDIIPETLLPGLAREVELTPSVAQLFATAPAPANGRRAYTSGRSRPHIESIPTADDPSNVPNSQLNSASAMIVPIEMAVALQMHRDIQEDGVISSLDAITADLRWSLVYGEADCIINGHGVAAGSHQDALATWGGRSLTPGAFATDHRTGFDGLRRLAFAKGTASDYSGVTGIDIVSGLQNDVGAEHLGQNVILMSPEYFLGVAIKWDAFQTWDKVGASAAVLTGLFGTAGGALPNQVGFIYNVPVCIVSSLTADLNASGVYDDTTVDRTGMLITNVSRYRRYIRKDATIESDVNIRNNTNTLVARRRLTFKEEIPGSGEKNVAFAFNLPRS